MHLEIPAIYHLCEISLLREFVYSFIHMINIELLLNKSPFIGGPIPKYK